MVTDPSFHFEATAQVGIKVSYPNVRFHLTISHLFNGSKEIGFIVRFEFTKNIVKFDIALGHSLGWPMQITKIKTGVRLIVPSKQRTKTIDDCALPYIVRPDNDI